MKRFKNILVVCDEGSNDGPALQRALHLAKANNAKVTLVEVINAAPGDLNRLFAALPGARPAQIADQVREYHATRLAEYATPFEKAGLTVTTKVLEGTAFLEIIRYVMAQDIDLLIKGVSAHGTTGGLLTHGYDLHLLRKCPCPVWMIKDTDSVAAGRILVAVDPDPQDQTRNALNTMVMEIATSLSQIDTAHLHILNVWRLQEEQALHSGRFNIDKAEIQSILDHEKSQSKARFEDLLDRFPQGQEERTSRHIKGLAGDVIPQYAAENAIDTIVMGTVGRTGIAGFFIGNTAEAILNKVNCSVIAVKPPGFITPVTLAD